MGGRKRLRRYVRTVNHLGYRSEYSWRRKLPYQAYLLCIDMLGKDRVMRYSYKIESYKNGAYKIIEVGTPGPLERLFGIKPSVNEHVGNGTVWHTLPNYDRVETWRAQILANHYTRYRTEIE